MDQNVTNKIVKTTLTETYGEIAKGIVTKL